MVEPIYTRMGAILCCDVLEGLAQIEDNSVDTIVTDPPAGISFMNKAWDRNKGGRDKWIEWMTSVAAECLRVAKPGAYALVWALPRTSHWTAMGWENGGWECRDCIYHVFAQGFPKSLDVSKAIGKKDIARQWEGFGTALKPAVECWWLFRKPLSEPTVADNVLKWGTGALRIDGCRIKIDPEADASQLRTMHRNQRTGDTGEQTWGLSKKHGDIAQVVRPVGRWPANLILQCICEEPRRGRVSGGVARRSRSGGNTFGSNVPKPPLPDMTYADPDGKETTIVHTNPDCPCAMLDAQSGDRKSGYMKPGQRRRASLGDGGYHGNMPDEATATGTYGDSGGASRFFKTIFANRLVYCPKASRAEREAGCEGLSPVKSAENLGRKEGSAGLNNPRAGAGRTRKEVLNPHNTVKPLALMHYLVRLVTPPNGLVLDPFCGSGTTLIAAAIQGFEYIGIDQEEKYCNIAAHRVRYWEDKGDIGNEDET